MNNSNAKSEMSFVDHLEALRWMIIRSLIALIVGAALAYWKIEWIIDKVLLGPTNKDFVIYKFLCTLGKRFNTANFCIDPKVVRFQNAEMSSQFLTGIRSAAVIGVVIASPFIFYEIWKFVRPALNTNERKLSRGIVFWVSLLFLLGVLFGYLVLTPYTVNFFAAYQLNSKFENIWRIDDYFNNLISLTVGTGLVFEIPVVVYFLSKIGIATPNLMQKSRKFAIMAIFFIAAFITPPDVVSMFIVAVPILALYEISIMICKRIFAKQQAAAMGN
jgi:sec-independent protein translocase protein TatC